MNQLPKYLPVWILLSLMIGGCSSSNEEEPTPEATAQSEPSPPPPEPVQVLFNRDQLEKLLADENIRVIDTRQEDDYLMGHIPGAVRVDIAKWREKGLSPGGLEDEKYWSDEIGKLAIGPKTRVVVYGNSPTNAARAWWHLTYAGVPNVALLDGGWDLWRVGGKPQERESKEIEPKPFPVEFQQELLVSHDDAKSLIADQTPDTIILDTRSEDEFAGKQGAGARRGHLPGAVHLEWSEVLDTNGRLKSEEELKALFAEHRLDPQKRIVVHCQSGGRASMKLFALKKAGFEDVANFYCGWSAWGADDEAPVED